MSIEKQRLFWAALFLLMVLAAFILPFSPVFTATAKIYGAFLFWILFAVAVIACLGIITSRWRDDDER